MGNGDIDETMTTYERDDGPRMLIVFSFDLVFYQRHHHPE